MAGPNVNFLSEIGDQAIINMARALIDENQKKKLERQKKRLQNLTFQLLRLSERQDIMNKKYKSYMNQLNTTLRSTNSIYADSTRDNMNNVTTQSLLRQLFKEIHETLNWLTGGESRTSEFAVYYNDNTQIGSGLFYREIFSFKEMYKAMSVSKDGSIIISRSAIMKLHESLKNTERENRQRQIYSTQNARYAGLLNALIEKTEGKLQSLVEEYNTIWEQANGGHIGVVKAERLSFLYAQLDELEKKIFARGELVQELFNSNSGIYQKYLLMSNKGNLTYASYNRGHIFEAFERLIRDDTISSYGEAFLQSLGNLPGWAGGDVKDIQVKSLIADKLGQDPEVTVMSLHSLVSLTSQLLYILNLDKSDDIKQQIKTIIKTNFDTTQTRQQLQSLLNNTINNLFSDLTNKKISGTINI